MREPTFIIAEAGVNHNGNVKLAERIIYEAKAAGADAVKFQHFNSMRLWGDDRIAHLELSNDDMLALKDYADDVGIEFCCTPFGVPELEFLAPLLRRIKIASGCRRNYELLYAAHKTGLPVILSTGMSTIKDIQKALGMLSANVTLLHCTSAYPCPINEVNLKAMDTLRVLSGSVGYSDHTEGINIALAAVARGATVIEKHLTLDRDAVGPDHKASIEPKEFKIMVDAIRNIEIAIGTGEKKPQPSEAAVIEAWYS